MRKPTALELVCVIIMLVVLLTVIAVSNLQLITAIADEKSTGILISMLNSQERIIWINVKLENIPDIKTEVWKRVQDSLIADDKAMAKVKREHNNPDSQPAMWSRK